VRIFRMRNVVMELPRMLRALAHWAGIVAFAAAWIDPAPVRADLFLFQGADEGANFDDERPNSEAAAADFEAHPRVFENFELIDFENAPFLKDIPVPLQLISGVTVELIDHDPDVFPKAHPPGITGDAGTTILGYNTTIDGGRFLRFNPEFDALNATVRFRFERPIQAFGVMIAGLETPSENGEPAGDLFAVFNGREFRELETLEGGDGGVQFFGFVDEGAAIVQLDFHLRNLLNKPGRDVFTMDDIRLVYIPEPAAWLSFAMGGGAVAAAWLRRRRRHGFRSQAAS